MFGLLITKHSDIWPVRHYMSSLIINHCNDSKCVNYLWNNNQHYLEDKKRAKNSGYTENSGFGKKQMLE